MSFSHWCLLCYLCWWFRLCGIPLCRFAADLIFLTWSRWLSRRANAVNPTLVAHCDLVLDLGTWKSAVSAKVQFWLLFIDPAVVSSPLSLPATPSGLFWYSRIQGSELQHPTRRNVEGCNSWPMCTFDSSADVLCADTVCLSVCLSPRLWKETVGRILFGFCYSF